jgi:AcrR family transcriptional regulator
MKRAAIPRKERHQLTKQAILKAARALVLEKGPDELSLREVARRVGHSPAGLYEYFGSKEEIVAALAAESYERLRVCLDRVPAALAPAERLIEIGLAYVDFARQNPEHFMLSFTRLRSGRTSFQQPLREASPYAVVVRAAQAGVDAGAFRTRDGYSTQEIAYGLWVIAHGMAMLQQTHLRAYQEDFSTADRKTLEVFVEGLVAR